MTVLSGAEHLSRCLPPEILHHVWLASQPHVADYLAAGVQAGFDPRASDVQELIRTILMPPLMSSTQSSVRSVTTGLLMLEAKRISSLHYLLFTASLEARNTTQIDSQMALAISPFQSSPGVIWVSIQTLLPFFSRSTRTASATSLSLCL